MIMANNKELTELEPVALSDQTEVKLPITVSDAFTLDNSIFEPSPMLPNTNRQLPSTYNSNVEYSQNDSWL